MNYETEQQEEIINQAVVNARVEKQPVRVTYQEDHIYDLLAKFKVGIFTHKCYVLEKGMAKRREKKPFIKTLKAGIWECLFLRVSTAICQCIQQSSVA